MASLSWDWIGLVLALGVFILLDQSATAAQGFIRRTAWFTAVWMAPGVVLPLYFIAHGAAANSKPARNLKSS